MPRGGRRPSAAPFSESLRFSVTVWPGTHPPPVPWALNWCNLYPVDTGLIVQGPMMNMQILNRLARRAGVLSLAAIPVIGFIGPSEAEPGGLAGSWSGGGWVSFASGSREKARCHARYTGGGGSYRLTATCATASGKASQTATVYKTSGNSYKGSFVNTQYNVRGSIRVTVHGKSQSVSLSGDGASAQLSLSRR